MKTDLFDEDAILALDSERSQAKFFRQLRREYQRAWRTLIPRVRRFTDTPPTDRAKSDIELVNAIAFVNLHNFMVAQGPGEHPIPELIGAWLGEVRNRKFSLAERDAEISRGGVPPPYASNTAH